jgi:tetratricopeptide (TPR) repeat protein
MFFKKFFAKDYRYYLEKGDKYFAEERYVDARHAFQEALEKIDRGAEESSAAVADINRKVSETGNRLALLNIAEAEHCAARGDVTKAEEHLNLAGEFSDDPTIRERAETLMGSLTTTEASVRPPASHHNHKHGCSGCAPDATAASEHDNVTADHLSSQERFELLIQPLPEGLPERYAAMGEKFAHGYLLVHDGEETAGAAIFQELLKEKESDILLYEIALVNFRKGNIHEGEQLLRRALTVNDMNPLCYLTLVQVLTDTGRMTEAIPLLNIMVDRSLLVEQALIYLGDIYQRLGNDQEAMEYYSKALNFKQAAKPAAERLVTLLQKHGRPEEATFLVKQYLKGCC